MCADKQSGLTAFARRNFLKGSALLLLLASAGRLDAGGLANPWVTSDAKPYGAPLPNAWSMEAFHGDPAFAGLAPSAFCRKLFDIYYDGRRQSWDDSQAGLTPWQHTAQEPKSNPGLIELDPVLLLNIHGSGYCGIQSGLLEGIYQSRPGGEPGKPAIDARRWYLDGIVHSVCDAYYDGRWHYFDLDLGGYAGDSEKDIWSIADVMADPKGYYGSKTTIRSKYFFEADGKGSWVNSINKSKSYAFQDCLMLGHEMSFSLRPGEKFTRFFSKTAAGWAEFISVKKPEEKTKGFCEMIYEPGSDAEAAAGVMATEGDARIFAIRCPYNISSSKVESTGKASYSLDLGRTWKPLPETGLVTDAAGRWDYLLKIEGGALKRVITRGMLHPGSLPRVGSGATTMTLASMADYDVLTWIPDWSSAEALAASTKLTGLKWSAQKDTSFGGGQVTGTGELVIPVKAPPGCRIVKLSACAIAGIGTVPDASKRVEIHLGPAGASTLAGASTDCSSWGLNAETKVDHWQGNANGSARFAPCAEAEVKIVCKGWGFVRGTRIYVGYVREKPLPTAGTLTVTHGYDGKTFEQKVAMPELAKGPFRYAVPEGAKRNEFITMAMADGPAAADIPRILPLKSTPAASAAPSSAPAAAQASSASAAGLVKDDWDWAAAMTAVAKSGLAKNREGVVLSLGDSLTYANQSTRWALNPVGATPEDKAVLAWSHAGKRNDSDGWHLASLDAPGGGRSETAVSGIRTDEYLAGGKAGIKPIKEVIEKYRPQVAFVLLGANDASAGRSPAEVARDMTTIIDLLLANGTVPVLQLVAPRADPAKDELTTKYNEEYVKIARAKKIPLIDLNGEFRKRAPDGAWKSRMLVADGVHFTHELSGGPPTDENLGKCGYLLRCWLSVRKLAEVKTKVIDKAK